MASQQSVSSILKPPKVRAPLKEIETVDQDADENTATLSKRKVSFSGMNKIKMYNTGATSLTVHQAPMFDEQISILSDSSNVEKPKVSEKFEKSDAQISIESTNCTNLEDNGRIIIEYESPNDNMEVTEALSGKILSDTIYTIDNNGSEHISYSSDYSENNMEFTEALKVGQILSGDSSYDLSSTEMSETLEDENDNEPFNKFDLQPSKPLSNVFIKNTSNLSSSSSCMDFTCANTKSNLINLSCNTQSSNMELTCMAVKSPKSVWSNDNYKSFSMELTQLPDRQTFEDNCELVYEYSDDSTNIESDISCEIRANKNAESKIVQTEKPEKNHSNHQIIDCVVNKSDDADLIEELSLSVVSMDIDPTLEGNEFDISYINVDNPQIVATKQNNLQTPMTTKKKNSENLLKSELDNYSNINDISYPNSESRISIFPTDTSFVQNMSLENSINKSVEKLQNTLHSHTSMLDQNQYIDKVKSTIVENNPQKNYSRKTMIYTHPLVVQEKSFENKDTLDIPENNKQKHHSRKSIVPTTIINDDVLDKSIILEENQQEQYSRKSIAPTSVCYQTEFLETEGTSRIINESQQSVFKEDVLHASEVLEENQQQEKYSRKSLASKSVFYQTEDTSDASRIDDGNQKSLSNEDVLNASEELEENLYQKCSIQSIAMSVLNQNQSLKTEDISNTSVYDPTQSAEKEDISVYNSTPNSEGENTSVIVEEYQPKMYSRKSVAPTTVFNEDISDTTEVFEENQLQNYSIQSIAMSILGQTQSLGIEDISNTSIYNPSLSMEKEDTSATVEGYLPKKYSRKTIGPTSSVFTHGESLDDSMLNSSLNTEEKNESEKAMSSVGQVSVNNQSKLQSDESSHYENKSIAKDGHQSVLLDMIVDDDLNSPFRKKTRKSIVSTQLTKPSPEDSCLNNALGTTKDNVSEKFENVSKMDISIEHESTNDNIVYNSSEFSMVSKEDDELHTNIVHNNICEMNNEKLAMTPNELETNKTNLNELVKMKEIFVETEEKTNNDSLKVIVTGDIMATNCILNSNYHLPSCTEDGTIKSNCVEDVSNISTEETIQISEKSCLVNRKRSYSNIDGAPLSCSSFMSKPNIHQSMDEDFITDDFIKQSPIKNDFTNRCLTNDKLENDLQVDLLEEESIKEHLCDEVLEFLTRWDEQFIEKKLVLEKCTNREWIFNVLDSNLILTISYSYNCNDYSFLKVEDISFSKQTIYQNEIIQFGINWILSKYNPKVYKQICFTSRDVELLLKSLLEDVHFISKVMNNMSYVRDVYCVTFKDNKAEFVVHNMNCPLMIRIVVSLSNIHKLSFKDVSVDCLFGDFNKKLLEKIIEDIAKDCYVLQSLVEKLRELYSHKINLPCMKMI